MALDTLALVRRAGVNPVLFGFRWDPGAGAFGLMPFVWGTVVVGVLALVAAVPLGLGMALWSSRRLPRPVGASVLGLLPGVAAVPSVIFGWWGLAVIVPAVRAVLGGSGFSLLAGGATLAVMILPTVAVLGAEAVAAVPASLEDASRALGATEDATLWRVTVAAAVPGLVRAALLGAGRALAETMAVQMVVGSQATARLRLAAPGSTLTTGILTHATLYPPGSLGSDALTAMAALLLLGTWLLGRELRRWQTGRGTGG
jgi:phosphate transport system permease protein